MVSTFTDPNVSATEHMSVPQLGKMFNLSDKSVRSYIHKYNTSGLEALRPKSPPGCRGKIAHFSKSDWHRLLEQLLVMIHHRINTKNSRRILGNGRLTSLVLISRRITRFLSTARDYFASRGQVIERVVVNSVNRARIPSIRRNGIRSRNLPLCQDGTIDA